jgi:hypothetical protein
MAIIGFHFRKDAIHGLGVGDAEHAYGEFNMQSAGVDAGDFHKASPKLRL